MLQCPRCRAARRGRRVQRGPVPHKFVAEVVSDPEYYGWRIFNTLRFTSRQLILRAAKKSPLIVNGRSVRFSPDYSGYTVKRRQAFTQAMNTARNKGVEFFLLYPATLKVKAAGKTEVFHSADDAEEFIRSLPMPRASPAAENDDSDPGPSNVTVG